MSPSPQPTGRPPIPSPQTNYRQATEMALAAVARQPDEQLVWLGAERADEVWRVPVLGEAIEVDTLAGEVTTSDGRDIGAAWRILVLHYLSITARPETRPPTTTFADLPASRTYASVYQGRVIARLCATAGRDAETLTTAAASLSGRPVEAHGDAAFDFPMFPRITLRLIWHAADDEFPPSATVLLPGNIEDYFCAEDIVMLSESLVSRLGGRPY